MRAFRNIAIFLLPFLIYGAAVYAPGSLSAEEEQDPSIKAFYIYNLILFVDWPKDIIKHSEWLCVAVWGDDPLYHHLRQLNQRTIKGQKLKIRRMQEAHKWPEECRVLFIGSSKKAIASKLLMKLENKPVLTISDMASFPRMGGMIRIKNLSGPASPASKRFEINIEKMKQKGLRIRARVLRLADIVYIP